MVPTLSVEQTRRMARTAFDVDNWACRTGLKKADAIEQIRKALVADLTEHCGIACEGSDGEGS